MDPELLLNLAKIAGVTLFVVFAVTKILLQKRWVKMRGIKAEAVIVELVENVTKGDVRNNFVDTITYYPVIRYTTHHWEHLTKQYHVSFKPKVFKVGDKVSIIYDSKKPDRYIVDDFNKVL
ncbi:DUF3592 domain-containing protein [Mucilaginibacter sp. AW1-3]